jgi:hypothetical protein
LTHTMKIYLKKVIIHFARSSDISEICLLMKLPDLLLNII